MRSLFWITLFMAGLVGVAIPATYFYTASKLPPVDSEFDIEKQLKHSIEGERMSYVLGMTQKPKHPITFTRPDFSRLPKDLVALYLTQMGCPTYFQTPREEGWPWARRLLSDVMLGTQPPGDSGCELIFAQNIALYLDIKEPLELTVAAHKIRSFLQKDQLIAYNLSMAYLDRGVVGVEDATRALFGRELSELQLAELAELQLALPPLGFWDDIKFCKNASMIRQNRDSLLQQLVDWELIPEERGRNAMAQPVACLTTKK